MALSLRDFTQILHYTVVDFTLHRYTVDALVMQGVRGEVKELEENVQKLTDKYIKDIDKAIEEKSKEIMTV